ncbi:hypothetical protein [Sporosarcina globispora]|uniref:hypothetical protein n=1 Tax=Sporosarcina globispora TaxID=1459 RepID=UPI000B1CE21E|nr:hypothetical protein [Sporosarcina globispora]
MIRVRYDIPIDEYYFIPTGSEVKYLGTEKGFSVIEYNQIKYVVNEGYLEKVEALVG